MKVAVLSDIHGNKYALDKVLDEIDKLNIDSLILLGDYVGYYHHAEYVINKLSTYNLWAISGNHDREMLQCAGFGDFSKLTEKYGNGSEYYYKNCSESTLYWLKSLSNCKEFMLSDCRIGLYHGSPKAEDEYIYPDCPREKLDEFSNSNLDVIFLGHTHYAFVTSVNSTLIVNPGSVGQARDIGGMASWCVFNVPNRSAVFRKTVYDIRPLLKDIDELSTTHHVYLKNILSRNR